MSTSVPIGFCFNPTDDILINNYLLNKTLGKPLPFDIIIERDLYGSHPPWKVLGDDVPWIVAGDNKKVVYVFTRVRYVSETNQNRIVRTAGCGSWMGKTGSKKIYDGVSGLIGKREMLVFESKDEKLRGRTGYWSMHEFALAGSSLGLITRRSSDENFVVCKIMKDESKLLKILPQPKKNPVSTKRNFDTSKTHKKKSSGKLKNVRIKDVELKKAVAKTKLNLDNVRKEDERNNSHEFGTTNSQERSSLTVAVPCVGMKYGCFQTQSYNEIVYNSNSYEYDAFCGDEILLDTDGLLALLERDEGNKRNRVYAQELHDEQINKKMRFSDFGADKSTSTPIFNY